MMKKEFIASLVFIIFLGQAIYAQDVDTILMYELDEFVVSAVQAKRETPVAFLNIQSQQLNENNIGQSLPYLFSNTPSVTITSDGGNGIGYATFRVRGTDANRINFTLDGVPINDSESHGVFWVNMPDISSSVEQVQIQRGVGTSTNGAAAFGATVAMQTKNPSLKPYAEVVSSAGSFNTYTNTLKGGTGLLYNHFICDARYSNVRTDGYIDRAKTTMNSYFASATYYSGATMLKFQTFGSGEVSYQAWNGVDSSMLKTNRRYNSCGAYDDEGVTKFYDNQTDNYWQHHYNLITNHHFSNGIEINATFHYTDGKGYYEDYKEDAKYIAYKLPNYVDSLGVHKKTDLVRRKWLRNDFYGGLFWLNYKWNKLETTFGVSINNYVGDHFGRVIWVKTTAALPCPDFEYYRNRGQKLDYNAFVKASYNFGGGLNAFADMQYRGINYKINGSDDKAGQNLNVNRNFSFFNPKVGLSYLNSNHNAYASFAVAHREPNRDNFTENGPSAQPTYETLKDWEAGYSYTTNRFHAGISLYYMDYDNQLILNGKISEIGEPLTTNIKDSYRTGIELLSGVKILPCLSWECNLTLSRNKIRNFVEYVDTYDSNWNELPQLENILGTTDIAFSPNIIANSVIEFSINGFSSSFTSSFVGRQYLDNTSSLSRSINPYFVNNLCVGYTFRPNFIKEISLNIFINNIFNEKYETNGWVWSYLLGNERLQEAGYFAQAEINFMARITLKF